MDGSTGGYKSWIRPVYVADLSKATQNMSDVRAEDTTIFMTFVDDHVSQVAKEPRPVAIVILQHRIMQHIWVCQYDLRLLSNRVFLFAWSSSVVAANKVGALLDEFRNRRN